MSGRGCRAAVAAMAAMAAVAAVAAMAAVAAVAVEPPWLPWPPWPPWPPPLEKYLNLPLSIFALTYGFQKNCFERHGHTHHDQLRTVRTTCRTKKKTSESFSFFQATSQRLFFRKLSVN